MLNKNEQENVTGYQGNMVVGEYSALLFTELPQTTPSQSAETIQHQKHPI